VSGRICFYEDVPPLIKPELEARLLPYEYLIPPWCSHVWIGWQAGGSDNESAVAEVDTHYDYRWARITVYASWLEQADAAKQESLIHELLHISLAVLSDYARDTIKLLIPEDEAPKFRQQTVEQLRERCESVTQDLTLMILQGKSARAGMT